MTEKWDGRPQNPERTAPHWLKTAEGELFVGHWDAQDQMWFACDEDDQYVAPCHTPAEVAALTQERDRLRNALREINKRDTYSTISYGEWAEIARAALKEDRND